MATCNEIISTITFVDIAPHQRIDLFVCRIRDFHFEICVFVSTVSLKVKHLPHVLSATRAKERLALLEGNEIKLHSLILARFVRCEPSFEIEVLKVKFHIRNMS